MDTTYFLPLIGISPSNTNPNFLLKLLDDKGKIQLLYSTLTIIELQAKGAKESENGNLDPQRILMGIQSLSQDENFHEIKVSNNSLITELTLELRKYHTNFSDCLILATALVSADLLITENEWINKFLSTYEYSNLIITYQLSKNFQVSSSKNYYVSV